MKLRYREHAIPDFPVPTTVTAAKRKVQDMDDLSVHCLQRPAIAIGERIIKVQVGKFRDLFQVHESLLQANSDFFKAALNPAYEFQESQGVVELLEEDPFYFRSFVNYVYFKKVLASSPTTDHEAKDALNELIGEFILAEKLQAHSFANDVVTAMIAILSLRIGQKLCNHFDMDQIRCIYENIPASSPLRRLCIDHFVYWGSAEWMHASDETELPVEFLLELTERLLRDRPQPEDTAPFVESASNYHKEDNSKTNAV